MRTAKDIYCEAINEELLHNGLRLDRNKYIIKSRIEPNPQQEGGFFDREILKLKYELADECTLLFGWWSSVGFSLKFLTDEYLPAIFTNIDNSIKSYEDKYPDLGCGEMIWKSEITNFLIGYGRIKILTELKENKPTPYTMLGKDGVKALWQKLHLSKNQDGYNLIEGEERIWNLLCNGGLQEPKYNNDKPKKDQQLKLKWNGYQGELYFILREMGYDNKEAFDRIDLYCWGNIIPKDQRPQYKRRFEKENKCSDFNFYICELKLQKSI